MKLQAIARRARLIKKRILLLRDFVARPPVTVDNAVRRIAEIVRRAAP